MFRNIFGCHSLGELLLAASELRPETLLDILQYTGQPPTAKNYPALKISSAEAERPSSMANQAGEKSLNLVNILFPRGACLGRLF